MEAVPKEVRVLVVDDDQHIREALVEVLELEGFKPLVAENGQRGLELLRAEKPDVVLLDLMMPVMNGWEFRQIQVGDPLVADIPVVVMTAHIGGADGIDGVSFIKKPMEIEDLVDTIKRAIEPEEVDEPLGLEVQM